MLKKQLLVLLSTALLSLAYFSADAQVYKSAVGLRLGYPWAVTYKTFISESSALEVYAGYRGWAGWSWFSVNGAYQVHRPFPNVDNLQWYFGGGAGILFWNFDDPFFEDEYGTTVFSIQGYLGLDYTFEDVPINLTLDWIPTFWLNGYDDGFHGNYGNLAVRYVLGGGASR
ncbi:MAG: hypothetical protein AAB316_12465 [Bacteroidota bacterium]